MRMIVQDVESQPTRHDRADEPSEFHICTDDHSRFLWEAVGADSRWRWAAGGAVLLVGVLGLHLPRYLVETASPTGYLAYPGLVLVAVMIAAAVAAVEIVCDRRFGWWLGIGMAAATAAWALARPDFRSDDVSQPLA